MSYRSFFLSPVTFRRFVAALRCFRRILYALFDAFWYLTPLPARTAPPLRLLVWERVFGCEVGWRCHPFITRLSEQYGRISASSLLLVALIVVVRNARNEGAGHDDKRKHVLRIDTYIWRQRHG